MYVHRANIISLAFDDKYTSLIISSNLKGRSAWCQVEVTAVDFVTLHLALKVQVSLGNYVFLKSFDNFITSWMYM